MARNHYVGIDIGDGNLRGVEVTGVGTRKPTVARFHSVPIPEGAVKNGDVIENNTVASALRQLWSQGRFRSKDVIMGVGNAKVLVRDLSLPKLAPRELKASLGSHVQDLLPVPADEALLDFYPITEESTPTGPVYHGLLVAAIKDAVLSNVRAIQKAGLNPVAVDLIPFALTRITPESRRLGTIAHVDVGSHTTNVVITKDGTPQFVRIIPGGGNDITQALINRLEMTVEQAETAKRMLGLAGSTNPEHQPAIQVIREATGNQLSALRNTLSFYASTRQNEAFSGIILTGGGSLLNGYADALTELSRIPVIPGDAFANINVSREAARSSINPGTMAVALGLALGGAA